MTLYGVCHLRWIDPLTIGSSTCYLTAKVAGCGFIFLSLHWVTVNPSHGLSKYQNKVSLFFVLMRIFKCVCKSIILFVVSLDVVLTGNLWAFFCLHSVKLRSVYLLQHESWIWTISEWYAMKGKNIWTRAFLQKVTILATFLPFTLVLEVWFNIGF